MRWWLFFVAEIVAEIVAEVEAFAFVFVFVQKVVIVAAAEREQSLHDFNEIMTGEDESDDSGIGDDDDFLNEDEGDSFDFGDDFGDEE